MAGRYIVIESGCSLLLKGISVITSYDTFILTCYFASNLLFLCLFEIIWFIGHIEKNYTTGSPPRHPLPLFHTHTHTPQHSPQWVSTGSGWCKAEVEKKETTASEVSQMEGRERGGWTEWGSKGRGEGGRGQNSAVCGQTLCFFFSERQWGATSWSSLRVVTNAFIYFHSLTPSVLCAADQSVFLFMCESVCLTEWVTPCFPFIVSLHGNRVIKPTLQCLPPGQCCIFGADADIDENKMHLKAVYWNINIPFFYRHTQKTLTQVKVGVIFTITTSVREQNNLLISYLSSE